LKKTKSFKTCILVIEVVDKERGIRAVEIIQNSNA